jgi:hypothetical protein
MREKKRVFATKRKAQSTWATGEQIAYLLIFSTYVLILSAFIYEIKNNTFFEKNYLTRDLAFTTSTLYASPSDVSYVYAEDMSRFDFRISNNAARVSDSGAQQESLERFYWFADESDSKLVSDDRFESPSHIVWVVESDSHGHDVMVRSD